MGKNRRKHQEKLARRASQPRPMPPARYRCTRCDGLFELPGMQISDLEVARIDEHGVIEHIDAPGWEAFATCPACGGHAEAVNSVRVEDTTGYGVFGFADTPEQMADLHAALAELQQLRADASLDEIIEVLEKAGPAARPVINYLKAHHLELAMLGIALATFVLMIFQWLVPDPGETPTPVPEGVTYEQMERLISEIRDDPPASGAEPQPTTDPGKQHGKR